MLRQDVDICTRSHVRPSFCPRLICPFRSTSSNKHVAKVRHSNNQPDTEEILSGFLPTFNVYSLCGSRMLVEYPGGCKEVFRNRTDGRHIYLLTAKFVGP